MTTEEAKKKKEEFVEKYIMCEDDITRELMLEEIGRIKMEFPEIFEEDE